MAEIRFVVLGEPQSQGSARAFIPKGWKSPIITSTNKRLGSWREAVSSAAQRALGPDRMLSGPVHLEVEFLLPRPKKLKARVRVPHTTAPDLDKLIRAIGDALANVLIEDDKIITQVTAAKWYAELDRPCGAKIALMELPVLALEAN